VVRVDAVRTAAVRDVLFVSRKLPKTTLELVDGDRYRAGNVACDILVCGAGVENHDSLRSQTLQQLLHLNRFCARTITEVMAHQGIELGQPLLGDGTNGLGHIAHGWIG